MPSIVLTSICLIAALLLSVINKFTFPKILKDREEKTNAAFTEVLPGASGREDIVLDSRYPSEVIEGYKFENGFVFKMKVKGYADGLVIMCGIDNDGNITGVKHLESKETYGLENGLNSAYIGGSLDSLELIIASGATKNSLTSKGYYTAIKAALQAANIALGKETDTRTPEQILQDNCNQALNTTDKTFTRSFESWSALAGFEIYVSDAGVVVVTGESFVGYPLNQNTPLGEHPGDVLEAANNAYSIYSSVEKIDLSAFNGINKVVTSVYKNSNGEYMFTLSAKGFKYASNSIIIELVINESGVITSCVTVSHSESGGYGSVCGEEEYYNQYVGKTAETYTLVPNIIATAEGVDPGTLGGATQTSNGYRSAVGYAFAALNIIKEGGSN